MRIPPRVSNALRASGPPLPFAFSVLALSWLGGGWAVWEAGGALVGVVLAELLRRSQLGGLGALWVAPAVLVAGVVTALSASSLLSELFAALGGLALLYWISAAPTGLFSTSRASNGLLLPGLSVALALLVTLFLPSGPARFGIACLLLVIVLLGLGWAIGSDVRGHGREGAGS